MPTTPTTTEPAEEQAELKRQTWRVLKLDDSTIDSITRWNELEPLSDEGEYGYYPGAEELGKAYGEGSYLLIERVEEGHYAVARSIEVDSTRYYHERREPEADDDQADELEPAAGEGSD